VRGRRAPLIAGAAVAVLALLFIFFLVLPKMRSVTETEGKLEEAENEHTALEAQLGAEEAGED